MPFSIVTLLCFALFLFSAGVRAEARPKAQWERITDCTLIENNWNDGDSFHIKAKGKERIFRLYYVDCPELEATYPSRIKSQKEYFSVSREALLKLGQLARTFSLTFMERKPLTIWTRWEDAKGDSKLKRSFALVELNGKDLGEILVKNGLARLYGKSTPMPDGQSVKETWKKLRILEQEARTNQKGAWAN